MFEFVIAVAVISSAASLWNIAQSVQRIAKDLRILSGRHDSKPPTEDLDPLADA